MNKKFFTVGPSQLTENFNAFINEFSENQYGSISHRSESFREIYKKTEFELRKLMTIPETHEIYFLSSASEIFERIILNCVNKKSFHFVNGAFSKKFLDFAKLLKKETEICEVPWGQDFEGVAYDIKDDVELICITQNETSTGVKINNSFIQNIKAQYPNKPIALDVVSSAPFVSIDFDIVDTAFFSVQKAFGLPAGLGVWIINKEFVEKCINKNSNIIVGAQNRLIDLQKNYKNFETPSTPNILDIFLFGKQCESFNVIGFEKLYDDVITNKNLLFDFFDNFKNTLKPFVNESYRRSDTIIVLENKIENLKENLQIKNLIVGNGYGKYKQDHIRIANFPALKKYDFENLINEIKNIN